MRIRLKGTSMFFKGVALGAAVAMVTLVGSAAVAGTGIGKVFNLGETNRVNARSQLEGAAQSAVLNVTNTSKSPTASGVAIDVPATDAPLVVNSATKVNNLNADLIDGRDSSTFQGAVSAACANGTAISSITPTGAATCNRTGVLPIDVHVAPDGSASLALLPSSLNVAFRCSDLATAVEFQNLGATPAEISSNIADAGANVTSGVGSQTLQINDFLPVMTNTQAEGQLIYSDQTTVSTVSITIAELGVDGCEYHGTVDEALRP